MIDSTAGEIQTRVANTGTVSRVDISTTTGPGVITREQGLQFRHRTGLMLSTTTRETLIRG
jgi:hypothetical protein